MNLFRQWHQFGRAPLFSYVNHKAWRGWWFKVPFSFHRFVMAAGIMCDAAFTHFESVKREPGQFYATFDELLKGTERQYGWLGQPSGRASALPAVRPTCWATSRARQSVCSASRPSSVRRSLRRTANCVSPRRRKKMLRDVNLSLAQIPQSAGKRRIIRFSSRRYTCSRPRLRFAGHGPLPSRAPRSRMPPTGRGRRESPSRARPPILRRAASCRMFIRNRSRRVSSSPRCLAAAATWSSAVAAPRRLGGKHPGFRHPDVMLREFAKGSGAGEPLRPSLHVRFGKAHPRQALPAAAALPNKTRRPTTVPGRRPGDPRSAGWFVFDKNRAVNYCRRAGDSVVAQATLKFSICSIHYAIIGMRPSAVGPTSRHRLPP